MTKIEKLLGMEFTEKQREAVSAPTDRLQKVVAGAGTGKTQVIVGRFLHLVIEEGYEPERILCITFTDYAASEMRRRVSEALQKAQFLGTECSEISTFHAFCHRLLRRYSAEAGLPEEFNILSEEEKSILLNNRVKNILLQKPLDFRFLTTSSLNKVFGYAVRLMDRARSLMLSVDEFEERASNALEAQPNGENRLYRKEIIELTTFIWREFERLKEETESIDYDDLILKAISLLKGKRKVRNKTQKRYQYILVDEAQDTSVMQQRLLELIARDGLANVTVVGDVRQAIYFWRNAHPEWLNGLGGDEHRLDLNFRSRNEILALANEIVNTDESLPRSALFNKKHKRPKEKRVFLHLFRDEEEQRRFLVETIGELRSEYALDEIAVLARARARLAGVEEALKDAGIPFKSFAHSIYDSPIVLDIAQWLRILVGEFDTKALARVLVRSPFRLRPSDLVALNRLEEFSLERAPRGSSGVLADSLKKIAEMSGRGRGKRIPELLLDVRSIIGVEDEQELADFERIFEKGVAFQSSRQLFTPLEFAEHLEQMHRRGATEPQSNPYLRYNAVKLLTLHSAKGLEFDVVFLFDMTNKRLKAPHIMLDEETYGVVPRRLPFDKTKYPDYTSLSKEYKEELGREERRLLHVGVTRARELLYITGPYGNRYRKFNGILTKALSSSGVKPFVVV